MPRLLNNMVTQSVKIPLKVAPPPRSRARYLRPSRCMRRRHHFSLYPLGSFLKCPQSPSTLIPCLQRMECRLSAIIRIHTPRLAPPTRPSSIRVHPVMGSMLQVLASNTGPSWLLKSLATSRAPQCLHFPNQPEYGARLSIAIRPSVHLSESTDSSVFGR